MTQLEKFNSTELDVQILNKSSNAHDRRKYVRSFLTKEFLSELVIEKEYSSNYIVECILRPRGYVTQAGNIISLCKEFGIPTKNIKESNRTETIKSLRSQTMLKKYGVPNVLCKGSKFYNKRNRTVQRKYGVSNVFQLESVKKKTKKTLYEKYKVYCTCQLPWYERNYGKRSSIHKKIEKILDELCIPHESEVGGIKFLKFNKHLNRLYSPIVDILIDTLNIIIEVNGDHWHANPKIYKSTDVIKKWGGLKSAEEIWKFDESRKKQLQSFGYKVITIWQLDIEKNIDKVKRTIYENCKTEVHQKD